MNSGLRRAVLSVSALGLVASLATGAVLGTGAASASPRQAAPRATTPPPPWEPDHSSVGGLVFYNSSGHVITDGSINASPIAAYVEGTNTIRAGDTKATLFGYLPVKGEAPGEFQGEQLGSSTTFPNTHAPAPLDKATLPVETGSNGDETVAQLEADFPNVDTSPDGYADRYQLRLYTSAKGKQGSTTYDSADIQISGDTWSVVYSRTTTSLTVTPAKTAAYGAPVKLVASVFPSAVTGSIEFLRASTVLKTVPLKSGSASLSVTTLPVGVNRLAAKFVPTGSLGFVTSTSATHALTITARATTTTLTASRTTIKKGTTLTLRARETPGVTGTFVFYDGKTKLATVKATRGDASFATRRLAVGTHDLKAVFTPSVHGYTDSTSKTLVVKVER